MRRKLCKSVYESVRILAYKRIFSNVANNVFMHVSVDKDNIIYGDVRRPVQRSVYESLGISVVSSFFLKKSL